MGRRNRYFYCGCTIEPTQLVRTALMRGLLICKVCGTGYFARRLEGRADLRNIGNAEEYVRSGKNGVSV